MFRINQYNVTIVSQSRGKSQLVSELGPAQPQLVFCIFSKMRRALHLLDFMFYEHSRGEKMAKKMFLPFLLDLIKKKSTQNNKYNVVRNKNSQKSDCVVHYML